MSVASLLPTGAKPVQVKISEIEIPERFKRDLDLFRANENRLLIKSIKAIGLRFPIVVKENDIHSYVLIDGLRRLHALDHLGNDEIRSYIIPKDDTGDIDILRFQFNVQREDLKPMDYATTIRSLVVEEGMKKRNIAKALGITATSLNFYLRCNKINDQWQKLINRGAAPLVAIRFISPLTNLGQRELHRAMLGKQLAFTTENIAASVRMFNPDKNPEYFLHPGMVKSSRLDTSVKEVGYMKLKISSISQKKVMTQHYLRECERMRTEIALVSPLIRKMIANKMVFELLPQHAKISLPAFIKTSEAALKS